ncbi:MAG: serine/threonine-protein kinase [Cyanobacteriota bacterium]|nr:serine/threonine-protein kinase [Cyanobacteriota bacterium]
MLGKTLKDRYQIIKHLGGGGFGQTYVAENRQLPGNPLCVVKQLKPKSNDVETLKTARLLFEREAQALYKLGHHDQIPQLLANFEEDEQFYLVQEFIEGNELKQELRIGNSLPETQVIELLQDILEVLEFVHQQGVIHRDIKPSNLIRRKHDGKIVLIDFGAVKQVSAQIAHVEGQTTLTVAVGSPGYMPNEQLGGKPRFCSDIYAVGMLGIQALTGVPACQLPEDPRTSEIIWRDHLPSEKATSPLVDVLDKMVRYDYRQRYQTVTEARQALTALTHRNLLKQSDTSATYTLRERSTSPQAILTTTQLSQISLSQKQKIKNILGEPSASWTDSPEHRPSVTISHKKSRRLMEIGTGIATGIALTLGISYFPSSNSLMDGGKNISLTNTLNSLFTGGQNISLTNTLTGHSKQVYSVVISPDGQTLVSGSVDNTIKLWNLSTGKLLHTLSGHSGKVKSVAITNDGQKIASGSGDGTIKLWN